MNYEIIHQIADHLLLNADNITAYGLYTGKAGVALALFESSRFLHDNAMEDVAFSILQESLIRKTDDIGFENGLSGVGYALTYLIQQKFVDADFDEIFSEQHKTITEGLCVIDKHPDKLLAVSKAIYFLSSVQKLGKTDKQINDIVSKIFKGMELYLSLQFFDWLNIRYVNNKLLVLQTFAAYLKLVHFSGYADFSRSLLSDYAALYRTGTMMSSLSIGYYLGTIIKRHNLLQYEDVAFNNMEKGMKDACHNFLALPGKIDAMNMLEACGKARGEVIRAAIPHETSNIHDIIRTLCPAQAPYAYKGGLARYLIYLLGKGNTLT